MPDNAIWAVTGPEHDARMARELAWIATGGQTGVVGPRSLRVRARPTPNNTVRIMPGGMSIAATSQQANIGYTSAPWQSYMRAIYSPLTVEIDPTGSSSGRTDVVGIVVDDPEFEGTSPDVDAHQYWRPHVVRNAGNNATQPQHFASLGRPFLPLAQIRLPRSTATITNDMIHDIRFMAVSRSHTVDLIAPANPSGGNLDIPANHENYVDIMEFTTQAPQWATRAYISMMITHLTPIGSVSGTFRVMTEGAVGRRATEASNFVERTSNQSRFQVHCGGMVWLGEATQGATSRLILQIRRSAINNNTGTVRIHDYETHTSMAVGKITYEEAPRFDSDGA